MGLFAELIDLARPRQGTRFLDAGNRMVSSTPKERFAADDKAQISTIDLHCTLDQTPASIDASRVIESLRIENLRGVRSATIAELTPLTVFVGPNGCGKSTLLDGILLAASRKPAASAGYVVRRRSGLRHGARWLIRGGQEGTVASASVRMRGVDYTARELSWSESGIAPELRRRLAERGAEGPFSTIRVEVAGDAAHVALAADNAYEATETIVSWMMPAVRIVDIDLGLPLSELYSRITERGMRTFVLETLRRVVPSLETIEVLTHHNDPRLHLTFASRSVPVAIAGEGVQTLLRLCLELGSGEAEGTYLLEEPESHQHPGAIRQSAKAIVAAIERNTQVILSTHSLELIDALLEHLADEHLDKLSVHRLRLLDSGDLATSRLAGTAVWEARDEVKDDLR